MTRTDSLLKVCTCLLLCICARRVVLLLDSDHFALEGEDTGQLYAATLWFLRTLSMQWYLQCFSSGQAPIRLRALLLRQTVAIP